MNDRARTRVQEAPLTYPKAMSSLLIQLQQIQRRTGSSMLSRSCVSGTRLGCLGWGPQGHGLPGSFRPFALDTYAFNAAFMKEGAGP